MYENPGKMITVKAPDAIESKYLPVKMTSTGIQVATAAGDDVIGFVQREGIASEALPVMINGVSMGIASDAIAKGDLVAPTTGGKLATAESGAYVGIALEAATAANDIIPILIKFGAIAAEPEEDDAEDGGGGEGGSNAPEGNA